jgi:hypothetical protein
MADRELTLEDLKALRLRKSNAVTPESLPATRAAPAEAPSVADAFAPAVAKAKEGNILDAVASAASAYVEEGAKQFGHAKTVAELTWTPYAVANIMAQGGIEFKPDWTLGDDVSEEEYEYLMEGLDEDTRERIADAAKSKTHLFYLANDAQERLAKERETGEAGWGLAPKLVVEMADPLNIGLAVVSGGSSVATKADRIVSTMRRATTLAEQRTSVTALTDLATAASKSSGAVRTGLLTGAESAAIETVLVQGDVTRDEYDVAIAAVAGTALGAGITKVMTRGEAAQVGRMAAVERGKLETAEFAAQVDAKRTEIVSALADVNAARADVDNAVGRAAGFIVERDGDLAGYQQMRHILESGGRADAKATTSSATGVDQFIRETWLGIVAKEKPAWAKGLSEEQLLELRKDPQKSGEMVAALNRDNEAILRKANAPVNVYTMYAMHHFGPKRGRVFALASADTKMDDILSPAALEANPYLRGKTKAEAVANWTRRAQKGGWNVEGAVNAAGASRAETRAQAALEGADDAAAEARIKEIEEILARQEGLSKDASGALKSGEVRKLQREAADLERELAGGHKTPAGEAAKLVDSLKASIADLPNIRARRLQFMYEEDVAKLGKEVADTKARTKLRESSVDSVMDIDKANLQRQLDEARDARGRRRYEAKTRLGEIQPRLAANDKATIAGAELKRIRDLNKGGALEAEGKQLAEALGLRKQAKQLLDDAAVNRTDTLSYLKSTAGKAADLDKLDGLDKLQSAADLRMQDLESKGFAPAFGEDTLSAARTVGFDAGLHPSLEGTSSGAEVGQMKLSGALKVMNTGTFSGVLRGSDNAVVRNELGIMVGNPLGQVGDGVSAIGASEIMTTTLRASAGKFNAAINPAYKAWLKERGIGYGWLQRRAPREQFMRQLGLAIRGEATDSAAVNSAVARVRTVFAEFLKDAKESGVPGFDNVQINDNYLPRVFDFHALHSLSEKVSYEELGKLVSKAIQQTYPELDDKLALRMGNGYITRMRNLRVGNDIGLMQGMSFDDASFLRQFLGETGMGSDEVEEVVAKFAAEKLKSPDAGEGGFRHAKRRVQFDENFSMRLRDIKANDGSTIEVKMSQLFENNVEALFGRYSRTMSGHIALAKVGIKGRADFNTRMRRVERELENDPAQLESVRKMANAAYDIITARPLEDSSLWTELGRTGRDVTYASQMENVGLSNIPDLATLVSYGNFQLTAKSFFGGDVFGAMWKRSADGRMASLDWREIEETFGEGTDFLSNQVFSSYDIAEEYAQELAGGKGFGQKVSAGFAKVGHGARVVSRGVTAGSGLAGINSAAQRMATRNVLYRIKNDVLRGKDGFSEARYASLGLSKEMRERIAAQFKKHTTEVDGEFGKKIELANYQVWDDLDAKDALLYAVTRESRKNVQATDLGDSFLFQHKGMGKVISQFRTFGLTAWTKQTLRGVAERDAETISRVLMQMTLAAGVWKLRHEMVLQGMEMSGADPEKMEEYRERTLTNKRIGAAMLRNAGIASVLPDVTDSLTNLTLGTKMFDTRNSGISSGILAGIPLASWTAAFGTAAGGTIQAMVREDRQFTKGTAKAWQALIPFGNHILVAPAIEALTADLPDKHDDPDPDSIDLGI